MIAGKGLDHEIAKKVMGWYWMFSPSIGGNGWFEHVEDSQYQGVRAEFNPSTDMNDAWMVAEKLYISVNPQSFGAPEDMKVHAETGNDHFGNYYEAFAETAPLAICKVALKCIKDKKYQI